MFDHLMNFFDLLFPNKRKQKEVDRFFLHSLAAHSGEYKDVLTAAFEKIKKIVRGGHMELMISYLDDAPPLDCRNDDSPFCSIKTNFGWIDFDILDNRLSWVFYETPAHQINITNCIIEEVRFYPLLFNTPAEKMLAENVQPLPPEFGDAAAEHPPMLKQFQEEYWKAYRCTIPAELQNLYESCNGASSNRWYIFPISQWGRLTSEKMLVIGEIETQSNPLSLRLDRTGKLYSSEHDDKPEELKTSLAEFLRSI